MGEKQKLELRFPQDGLVKNAACSDQAATSSPDLMNVRPRDVFKERSRGSSRPGLAMLAPAPSANPIRLMNAVHVKTNDKFTFYADGFDYSSTSHLSPITNYTTSNVPSVEDGMLYVTSTVAADRASFYLPALTGIDSSATRRVGVYIKPYNGTMRGSVLILVGGTTYFNATLVLIGFSVSTVTCQVLTTNGSGSLTSVDTVAVAEGITNEGWFEAELTASTVTTYWRGTKYNNAVSATTGTTYGVIFNPVSGRTQISQVRAQYYVTTNLDILRPRVIKSQNGIIYKDGFFESFTASASSKRIASDRTILSAERGQKLYIADHGEPVAVGTDGAFPTTTTFDSATFSDWTAVTGLNANDFCVNVLTAGDAQGTRSITTVASGNLTVGTGASHAGTDLSFQILREPKIYDPVADTITAWRATDGTLPVGCSMIARYRDRIVLAGDPNDANELYMSRVGDPLDWDFAVTDDIGAAFKMSAQDQAGIVGEPITAIMPYNDDNLFVGCRNSLYILRGDPMAGGRFDSVSRVIGVVGRTAWCHGPMGEIIWLSRNGLYMANPKCLSCEPVNLSKDSLPQELQDLNPSLYILSLGYDIRHQGVVIGITPNSASTSAMPAETKHWFFDWKTKGFFPESYPTKGNNPTCMMWLNAANGEDSCLLLGTYGGDIVKHSSSAWTDLGTAFTSYAKLGPFPLGDGISDGMVTRLRARLAADSNSVTWTLYTDDTAEGAIAATTAAQTGAFTSTEESFATPRARGEYGVLKLQPTTSGQPWSFESVILEASVLGRARGAL